MSCRATYLALGWQLRVIKFQSFKCIIIHSVNMCSFMGKCFDMWLQVNGGGCSTAP